jgi:hypothetical protein
LPLPDGIGRAAALGSGVVVPDMRATNLDAGARSGTCKCVWVGSVVVGNLLPSGRVTC